MCHWMTLGFQWAKGASVGEKEVEWGLCQGKAHCSTEVKAEVITTAYVFVLKKKDT